MKKSTQKENVTKYVKIVFVYNTLCTLKKMHEKYYFSKFKAPDFSKIDLFFPVRWY